MPRRARPRYYGQHGKSKKGRPRGWHRKSWSPDVRRGVSWLHSQERSEGEAA